MVTENPEPTQAPLPEPDAGGDGFQPEVNPLIAEVDRLNTAADTDIPDAPVAESVPEAVVPPVPPTPVETQEPAAAPPPVATQPPGQPQPNPAELEQMAQQAAQYQQVQQRAQLQQEAQRYQQQLETQGYLPDQAQQIAYQHMQSRSGQIDLTRQHEQQTQEVLGRQAASEHFAKLYNLSFADLATLRLANTPEQMEQIAKKISDDRKVRDELADLRKAQVPPQQFDNSQGAPEVAANDGSWLDRYNAGDRSSNAVAAAKKVLGI